MALRITGGELKGRMLRAPKGQGVRPTSGRVREALFSILGQDQAGTRVLDLCAGAGSLGIEAASRGAERVVFVELAREHVRVLRENASLINSRTDVEVRQGDARQVLATLARRGDVFDLVFLDPPYAAGVAQDVLAGLSEVAGDLLSEDAVVVVEEDGRVVLPHDVGQLVCTGPRRYGDTHMWLYRSVIVDEPTGE